MFLRSMFPWKWEAGKALSFLALGGKGGGLFSS